MHCRQAAAERSQQKWRWIKEVLVPCNPGNESFSCICYLVQNVLSTLGSRSKHR